MISAKIHDWCGTFLHDAKKIFLFSLGLGTVISVISVLVISDIYRDVANVYAYHARELGAGDLAGGWVGGVPMLNILLAGGLVRLGMDAYRACVTVSCAFYVLTLFPLRRYLERWLSPLASAYGCLLFIVTPKVIRYSVSGPIDSTRYFFLIGALLFMFRLIEDPTWRRAVMFGLCTAGMAVSRGEGIVVSLIMLSVLPLLSCLLRGSYGRKPVARHIAVAATAWVVFFVGISPFCTVNLIRYNTFVTDIRFAERIPVLNRNIYRHGNSTGKPPAAVAGVVYDDDEKESLPERIYKSINSSLRGGFELYWAFAIFGIITLLRRRQWRWEFSVLLAAYLIHQAIYFSVSISYRYSIYMVPMFMPLTVVGLGRSIDAYRNWHALDRWRTALDAAWIVVAVIVGVACIDNGMEIVFNRSDDPKRAAAAFIREWGARNVPDRRLRIADDGYFPEVIYWSEAFRVSGVSNPRRWDECRDCDLIFVGDRGLPAALARSNLKFLKSFVLRGKNRGHLFQVTAPTGKGQT